MATSKKTPAKKATAKKAVAKTPAKKATAKKAAPKKAQPRKAAAPKTDAVVTINATVPEEAVDALIVRVNDVKSGKLRSRMLSWFKK